MATLQISKHHTALTSNYVSKEEFKAEIDQIQKRINRIKKIQKAKNWKRNLTK